jgi:ABC-type amino acid transport system permease subunit
MELESPQALAFAPYFINSIVITLPATIFPIVIATMAAYALAWIRFRGSNFLFPHNVLPYKSCLCRCLWFHCFCSLPVVRTLVQYKSFPH